MDERMNSVLQNLLDNESPRIATLSDEEKKLYNFGLRLLGHIASENFFDIPKIDGNNKFEKDGLFYSIPYFDDEQLWSWDNKRMLLVVYKIENQSSFCPLSMDVQIVDQENFKITVNDQSGEHTVKRDLIIYEGEKFFTEIDGYETITLSELVNGVCQ